MKGFIQEKNLFNAQLVKVNLPHQVDLIGMLEYILEKNHSDAMLVGPDLVENVL